MEVHADEELGPGAALAGVSATSFLAFDQLPNQASARQLVFFHVAAEGEDGVYDLALTGLRDLAGNAREEVVVGQATVDGTPPPVGNSLMDIVARGIHHGLYGLLILLSITGFMTLLTSAMGAALVTGEAILLPDEYTGPSLIPHAVHEILVTVLMVVVLVHILGAIKHQFITKDGLMRRMSLRGKGRRPA